MPESGLRQLVLGRAKRRIRGGQALFFAVDLFLGVEPFLDDGGIQVVLGDRHDLGDDGGHLDGAVVDRLVDLDQVGGFLVGILGQLDGCLLYTSSCMVLSKKPILTAGSAASAPGRKIDSAVNRTESPMIWAMEKNRLFIARGSFDMCMLSTG